MLGNRTTADVISSDAAIVVRKSPQSKMADAHRGRGEHTERTPLETGLGAVQAQISNATLGGLYQNLGKPNRGR